MCTNFTPTQRAQWVKEKLGVDLPAGYPEESYPGFASPIVVKSHQTGRVACGLARFGLIPAWAKDDKISRHTYNARSETAAEKHSYRTAWRQRQYGLVLVDNFYGPKLGSLSLANGEHDLGYAFNLAGDGVARQHRCDAFGCAGVDQITGLKVIVRGEICNDFSDIPNQFIDIGGLLYLPVHLQCNVSVLDRYTGHWHNVRAY